MFPFTTVQFDSVQGVPRSLRSRCLFLGTLVKPCIGLCNKPVRQKKRGNSSFFTCYSVNIFHAGLRVNLGRACAFDTVRPRSGAPRSFRYYVSSRNSSNLSLSWVFVTLHNFHENVPFEYFPMPYCELQGRIWWTDCWFVAKPASWHPR